MRTVALVVALAEATAGKRVPFSTEPVVATVVVSEASVVVMEVDIAAASRSVAKKARENHERG